MTMPVTNERATRCPRCGYDLRGAIEAWQDACPLRGTCTECGLAIQWAEVLVPERFEPPWCVEFAKPLWRFGWACVLTICRSGRPPRFWSALKMSMPLHTRRLAFYIAVLLLPVLTGGVVLQSVTAVRVRYQIQHDLTRQAARFINAAGTPWTVQHSYAAAVAEAVVFPWRSRSSGTVAAWGAVRPYPGPRRLHGLLAGHYSRGPNASSHHALVFTLVGVAIALWVALTMPLAFVLLPISRRRAKVRRGHLMRVACYGMVIPSAIVTAILVFVAIGYAIDGLQPAMHSAAHFLGRYGIMILTIGWWIAAIRRYLHIPHGWAVAPILAFLAIMVLVGAVYIPGSLLQ